MEEFFQMTSTSAESTLGIGGRIGGALRVGDVVCLEGQLGTGKSVLVRGIAGGLGYRGVLPSPTFTIIRTYPEQRLCHMDAFRVPDARQILMAGADEYLGGDWICAVEWAERVRRALPEDVLWVKIAFGDRPDDRLVRLYWCGDMEKRIGERAAVIVS